MTGVVRDDRVPRGGTMSDKEAKKKDEPGAAPAAAGGGEAKKKPPIKLIGIVAALMLAEGAAVYVVVGMSNKKPQVAEAKGIEGGKAAGGHGGEGGEHGAGGGGEVLDENAEIELKLVEDKLQNMQTGRVWLWDVAVYVKVKKKNETIVAEQLKRREAEIKEEVSRVFSRAQHSQLKEPGKETLNRQLTALVHKIFGTDAEGTPRVERVLIPRCRGFATD